MKFGNLKENVSLVANLGVLLGIVFLITEINQSNRIATNEAETNLSIMGNELNRNVQSSADFMVKLTSSESQLTEAEEIKLASITLEHFNTWGPLVLHTEMDSFRSFYLRHGWEALR